MAAQRDPIHEWRENFGRTWLRIDFRPISDAPFRASFTPIFEELRIAHTVLSPGVTFRDSELVRDGDDAYSLVVSRARNLDVTHQGRDLLLGRGDATLLRLCETGSVASREGIGYLAVLIPPHEIAARGAHFDETIMQRLRQRSEALHLLCGYLRVLQKKPANAWTDSRETIRRHIIDLVALAVTRHGAVGESSLSAVAAARLNAALDCIAAHLHKPELSVASLAKSQGISPRYLHRLIETTGTSFTERVNELRLQRAFAQLTEARDSKRRISDIALDVGFSDISHFNRLFRSRFGETPSSVRGKASKSGPSVPL